MDTFIRFLGIAAGICIPLAFLPQTIKLIKTKKTTGLSLYSYLIYETGGLVFLIYGALLKDPAMIICQTLAFILNAIIITIIITNILQQRKAKITPSEVINND